MEAQEHASDKLAYFSLLGKLEIRYGEARPQLKGRRPRVVLASLVCRAGEIVNIEDLIDAVWEEGPPATVRGQIYTCISVIRRLLSDIGMGAALAKFNFGYSLTLQPGQCDIDDFASLVSEARAACDTGNFERSVQKYRSALGLWRGAALGDIDSEVLRRRALALDEERIAVLEEYIDLELLHRRERTVLPALVGHVARNPLREKLRGQLMLALYRTGRRGDALQVYRDGREIMVRELGLEPSDELRRLEAEILNDVPELASGYGRQPGSIVPRQLPSPLVPFTGRRSQMRWLVDTLADHKTPKQAVNLFGQGGVGKTSLAIQAAYELAREHDIGVQLFYDLRGSGSDSVSPARVLDHFLRVMGVPTSDIPESLDERAALFRSCLAGRRAVLILDDAADELQLQPMLPGEGDCAVIVTSRRPQTGLPAIQNVHLTPMSDQEAVELLERIIGQKRVRSEPIATAQLARSVEGLPLALSIVGARLMAAPHRTAAFWARRIHDEHRRLDELVHGNLTVRGTIASTYSRLTPELRELLSGLSLFNVDPMPGWMVTAALGRDVEGAHDLLDEAVAHQLLTPVDVEPTNDPHFRFHSLTRLFLREKGDLLPHEQRVRTVGGVVDAWLSLMRYAHDGHLGGDLTPARGRSSCWRPPEPIAQDVLANPLRWIDAERSALLAVVQHAAEYELDEPCWELAVSLAPLFEVCQYYNDWKESHDTALDVVVRMGNVHGEAATLCSLGSLYLSQLQADRAIPYLEKALALFEELNDPGGTALAVRNFARSRQLQGELGAALRDYGRAADLFLKAGDPLGQVQVWCKTAQIHTELGNPGMAEQQLTAALRTCLEIGDPRVMGQALDSLSDLPLSQGRLKPVLKHFQEALVILAHEGRTTSLHERNSLERIL